MECGQETVEGNKMNEISVVAVGTALIAGLVSMLGLIIGKEQKISEFRQAWIDELRQCVVDYLVSINAICDIVRLKKSGDDEGTAALLGNYKTLNQANHGIALRVNDEEDTAKALLSSMVEFEGIAQTNASLTPEKIRAVEARFTKAAKELLKFEWKRVKAGEKVFIWTKRIIFIVLIGMFGILAFALYDAKNPSQQNDDNVSNLQLLGVSVEP
jgi:hypothetical protein